MIRAVLVFAVATWIVRPKHSRPVRWALDRLSARVGGQQ